MSDLEPPALLDRRPLYNFFLSLFLLITFISSAQKPKAFSTVDWLGTRLQSHVLIHQDSILLTSLKPLFERGTPIALKLSKKETVSLSFLREYKKHYSKLIVISDVKFSQDLMNGVEIKQIEPKEIEQLIIKSNLLIEEKEVDKSGIEKFRSIYINNFETITDSLLIEMWEKSGKLSNFIYADKNCIQQVDSLVSLLNNTRKIFGMISSEGEMLKDVSFKNFKNRNASGYFSFPFDANEEVPELIPYKAGYHFSPDIIYVTPENFDNLKEFTGYKLELDYGLSDYFKFGKEVSNVIRKNDSEIISNNLKIINDNKLGNVGFFDNRSFIDAGMESKTSLQGSFTISTWIKPTRIDFNNSILGKGKNFVLKLRNGNLTFTMAGIKDYISKTSPILINEWTHISLVHSKINNELLFYVNGELTDEVEMIADYITSDYNLLVGSNLWEEFFIGYIGEIKIWERELNANEILLQYIKPKNISLNEYRSLFLIAGFIVISFLLFVFFKTRKKKRKKKNKELKLDTVDLKSGINSENEDHNEKILCFGELKIINNKGANIATKLSPKLKSLFVLIFLNSVENEGGISSKKLTEILWPGMNIKSAKNTRGTYIQHLRAILSSCSEIELVFQDKKWRINVGNTCYCDYQVALNYFENILKDSYSNALIEKKVSNLISILKGGRFLKNSNYSWLDPFIEKFSNLVIEKNIELISQFKIQDHSDLLFDIAEVIAIYDDLNETSLKLKLQVLRSQGKLSLAHTVYDNYVKLYKNLYKEDYKQTFETLISEKNTI